MFERKPVRDKCLRRDIFGVCIPDSGSKFRTPRSVSAPHRRHRQRPKAKPDTPLAPEAPPSSPDGPPPPPDVPDPEEKEDDKPPHGSAGPVDKRVEEARAERRAKKAREYYKEHELPKIEPELRKRVPKTIVLKKQKASLPEGYTKIMNDERHLIEAATQVKHGVPMLNAQEYLNTHTEGRMQIEPHNSDAALGVLVARHANGERMHALGNADESSGGLIEHVGNRVADIADNLLVTAGHLKDDVKGAGKDILKALDGKAREHRRTTEDAVSKVRELQYGHAEKLGLFHPESGNYVDAFVSEGRQVNNHLALAARARETGLRRRRVVNLLDEPSRARGIPLPGMTEGRNEAAQMRQRLRPVQRANTGDRGILDGETKVSARSETRVSAFDPPVQDSGWLRDPRRPAAASRPRSGAFHEEHGYYDVRNDPRQRSEFGGGQRAKIRLIDNPPLEIINARNRRQYPTDTTLPEFRRELLLARENLHDIRGDSESGYRLGDFMRREDPSFLTAREALEQMPNTPISEIEGKSNVGGQTFDPRHENIELREETKSAAPDVDQRQPSRTRRARIRGYDPYVQDNLHTPGSHLENTAHIKQGNHPVHIVRHVDHAPSALYGLRYLRKAGGRAAGLMSQAADFTNLNKILRAVNRMYKTLETAGVEHASARGAARETKLMDRVKKEFKGGYEDLKTSFDPRQANLIKTVRNLRDPKGTVKNLLKDELLLDVDTVSGPRKKPNTKFPEGMSPIERNQHFNKFTMGKLLKEKERHHQMIDALERGHSFNDYYSENVGGWGGAAEPFMQLNEGSVYNPDNIAYHAQLWAETHGRMAAGGESKSGPAFTQMELDEIRQANPAAFDHIGNDRLAPNAGEHASDFNHLMQNRANENQMSDIRSIRERARFQNLSPQQRQAEMKTETDLLTDHSNSMSNHVETAKTLATQIGSAFHGVEIGTGYLGGVAGDAVSNAMFGEQREGESIAKTGGRIVVSGGTSGAVTHTLQKGLGAAGLGTKDTLTDIAQRGVSKMSPEALEAAKATLEAGGEAGLDSEVTSSVMQAGVTGAEGALASGLGSAIGGGIAGAAAGALANVAEDAMVKESKKSGVAEAGFATAGAAVGGLLGGPLGALAGAAATTAAIELGKKNIVLADHLVGGTVGGVASVVGGMLAGGEGLAALGPLGLVAGGLIGGSVGLAGYMLEHYHAKEKLKRGATATWHKLRHGVTSLLGIDDDEYEKEYDELLHPHFKHDPFKFDGDYKGYYTRHFADERYSKYRNQLIDYYGDGFGFVRTRYSNMAARIQKMALVDPEGAYAVLVRRNEAIMARTRGGTHYGPDSTPQQALDRQTRAADDPDRVHRVVTINPDQDYADQDPSTAEMIRRSHEINDKRKADAAAKAKADDAAEKELVDEGAAGSFLHGW